MKKVIILFITSFYLLAAKAQEVNDPNVVKREARGFHAIHASNSFDIYLTQDKEEAVAVSAASTKDRDKIIVEVKDGILYIGMEKGFRWNGGNKKLRAYISFKQLDQLNISGACDVYIKGVLTSDELQIKQSGASDLKGKLSVNKLSVDLSGASDMTISGTASQVNIEASGASDFKGFDLVTEVCNATASGASDIRVTVNKELSASASGASDVKFKGNGVIRDLKSSGASSVSRG